MRNCLIKGALLHDIGKLIQRATGEKREHSSVGANYLKEKDFDTETLSCVKYHHKKDIANASIENNSLAYIVYEADNVSSALDRRENINELDCGEWKSDIALKTIFSTFKTKSEDYYYPLRDLNPDNKINYPVKEVLASSDRYSKLKQTLDRELNSGLNSNSLMELLESTMSFVPSSTNTKQNVDISLFDHSKTTAMISACMFDYFEANNITDYKTELFTNPDRDKKYYLLVSGDISGVQDFIYTISSKGALKSLRARSFYLDMILEHIADEILESINCSRVNLMYNGGGHFYMLLPNTDEVLEKLEYAEDKINEWLISEFGIDLYLALASTPASSNELMNTKSIFKIISLKLSKKKQTRYSNSQLKNILIPQNHTSHNECSICRTTTKETSQKDELGYLCNTCYNLMLAGKRLITDNIVLSVTTKKEEYSLPLPSLDKNNKYLNFKKINNAVRYYVKNERFTGENYATNLFVGDYSYQIDEKRLVELSDFVADNTGINRLAAFRCDVDNLGLAFTSGFSDEYSTISRVTSLSRQLSLFFKFYINKICAGNVSGDVEQTVQNFYINDEENKTKKLVIVYSGGDDVFVIGAWIDIINFAVDLREAFRAFTCDKLTLSGGIGLFSSSYPISQIASQSGILEDIAKKYDNDTKDAIALYGIDENSGVCKHVYHWDELAKEVVSKVKFLNETCYFDANCVDKNKVFFSTSMIYKFKNLLEKIDAQGKQINIARFAYTLARIIPNPKTEIQKKFKDNIYNWALKERKSLITALETIVYINRKEAQND